MGSSLGPTLANMFLAHVECEKLFNDITNNIIILYFTLIFTYAMLMIVLLFLTQSQTLYKFKSVKLPTFQFTVYCGSWVNLFTFFGCSGKY